MLTFSSFSRKPPADHVKPFEWAFKMWETSTYKLESATLEQLCAEPFESDEPANAFNLCANAMPLLNLPYLRPTDSEMDFHRRHACTGRLSEYPERRTGTPFSRRVNLIVPCGMPIGW